jgi:hypothetical protein
MKVGDLVKYAHAMDSYFGVVVAIQQRPLDAHGQVYEIQWTDPRGSVRHLKYLQSESLYKVAS